MSMSMLVLIKYYVYRDRVQFGRQLSHFSPTLLGRERSRVKHKAEATVALHYLILGRGGKRRIYLRALLGNVGTSPDLLFCVHLASHHKNLFFWL